MKTLQVVVQLKVPDEPRGLSPEGALEEMSAVIAETAKTHAERLWGPAQITGVHTTEPKAPPSAKPRR